MALTHGSLFAGIGGFDLGFERAGFRVAWQVEREPFCLATLKTRWPAVQRFTDVCGVGKANLAKVDCITAGVPCQDVSVAGRRAGLSGERTGLFYEFARILQELRPAWFVFENVPGLFSSNQGRDFAEILRVLMVECGYGVSWRVLDSRYFNVAQRRERVFIVGRFGKPCPPEILFEFKSGERNPSQGREARKDIAVPLTSGSGESRPGRRMEDGWNIVSCFDASPYADREAEHTRLIAATLRESDGHHGRSSPRGDGCDNLVAATLGANPGGGYKPEPGAGIVAIAENQRGEVRTSSIAPQLSAGGGKPGSGYSAVAYTLREDPGGTGQGHNTNYVVSQPIRTNPYNNSDPGMEARSYIVHKERSGIEQHAERQVDGAMQRTLDDCAAPDSDRVRDFASLPKGMDSPRYRALGNAVTATVAEWIGRRIVEACKP